jgi:hypothetical protein
MQVAISTASVFELAAHWHRLTTASVLSSTTLKASRVSNSTCIVLAYRFSAGGKQQTQQSTAPAFCVLRKLTCFDSESDTSDFTTLIGSHSYMPSRTAALPSRISNNHTEPRQDGSFYPLRQ